MIDYTDLINDLRNDAMRVMQAIGHLGVNADDLLQTRAADAITALEYALARSQPLIDRNAVLEEAATVADHCKGGVAIEFKTGESVSLGIMCVNSAQSQRQTATAIASAIRHLKSQDPIYDVSDTGSLCK